jgi:energy-converting hydrogenase Eha subunit H
MDFTFNIFLQLFISNVQVVTNMSSGVTSNSKQFKVVSLRYNYGLLNMYTR